NADGHKFRPISLAATQESHILQIRSGMPVDVRGIQWLAMGVTAQSSYIPFYPAATDVHPAYKVGSETYDDKSRSEEHTSELQSRFDLVCRLLLEKKK